MVICSPPDMFHGRGREFWGMTSVTVIGLSVAIYFAMWWKLKRTGKQAVLDDNRRIFRSVFAISFMLILGWCLYMALFILVRFILDLQGQSLAMAIELNGLPANTTLSLNLFVLYYTSTEYRAAFRNQLRSIPIIGRLIPVKQSLS
ncbi:hypothetical protein PENTCL1PPCAC_15107, partial [Pristionchus entomophagus]